MKNAIILLTFLLATVFSVAQETKISDFSGEWKTDKEFSYGADEMTITTNNNYVKIKTGITGSCPYVFEYKNAKFTNGKISATRVQYDSGGATSNSNATFELKNGKIYVTDFAQYGCGDKTLIFSKKANPIDEIIGTYKLSETDYKKHQVALTGNYGRYIKISKSGSTIKVEEYELYGSTKENIKWKNYKYDKASNTIKGVNYMQDEYDTFEKKFTMYLEKGKITRKQVWWGFPDSLTLNYERI